MFAQKVLSNYISPTFTTTSAVSHLYQDFIVCYGLIFNPVPILNENSPLCSLCTASKGICYDINDDDIGDGCLCPSMYSTAETQADFKHQNEFCSISHCKQSK